MSGMDATGDRNLSPQQIRSTIEQARKAWIAGDADTLAELFTIDAQLIVPNQRWQGREQIREEIAKFARAYANISITIYRIIIDSDRAAVEWHYEDLERATGKHSQSDDAIVIEFQNGLISYWREYFDTGGQSER
ncbi:nuclear transport factor 2 family protein [Chamaesiphon sp. VAR_69_metabat_338]|uniref:nuclear transport factor 2 family protein n=1 Tax=Chamaesiphon sp. VAR_69_metabat_338 TaxID=2964704 RepID=UPI00286DCF49|nr:nuclear transport factor 2 family protein [Chamaesiphon sp. VAR_69_metabat_338]